jgi:hypothetical protein
VIDGKPIREALIEIGNAQKLDAIACIAVGASEADIQFMSDRRCPYRLDALRVLAVTLRSLADRVNEAITELDAGDEPDLIVDDGSAN